jgi:hypothetical protein
MVVPSVKVSANRLKRSVGSESNHTLPLMPRCRPSTGPSVSISSCLPTRSTSVTLWPTSASRIAPGGQGRHT